MFQRTVSFWRRLLGSVPEATPSTQVAEERRQSVRYAADHPIGYRPASSEAALQPGLTAQLRNVSAGGISLLTDREFIPGDLLSIELPGTPEAAPATVLACVVHATPHAEGQWAVGCTFSSELSRKELGGFGPESSESDSDLEDQRNTARYYCQIEANYQPVAHDREVNRPARVLNISTTGIGLAVDQPIAVGKLLNVELHSVGQDNFKNLLCCAVHVTKQSEEEWLVGCNFINELEESELKLLMEGKQI